MFLERDKDTICALSTPPGVGGIAVIRISGPRAAVITRKLAPFLPEAAESHRVYYGFLVAPKSNEKIDEVLLSFFAEGKSFTGEETIEISCHGSQVISDEILRVLSEAGARPAERGEFTYRAFMNGRLDLIQAESVLSLVESQSKSAARLALRQLQGGASQILQDIEDRLLWVLAHLEANIDFAHEDIEVATHKDIHKKTQAVLEMVDKLLNNYRAGRLIQNGLRVALIGKPNVGKSSLLNALLGEDRAIVTDIPGTTRDFIEATMMLAGVKITLVDTAGLRETKDQIEKIGIEKTRANLELADVIVYVFEPGQKLTAEEVAEILALDKTRRIFLVNKIDDPKKQPTLDEIFTENSLFQALKDEKITYLSAQTRLGLDQFQQRLLAFVPDSTELSATLSNARHFELLLKIKQGLEKAGALMVKATSPEFIAFELHVALLALHELLGKQFDDQVMDRVFKEFCLGK